MNLSKETIERFLTGQCTPEETVAILEALDKQPYLLDAWISQEEWNEIDEHNTAMPSDAQERTAKVVLEHTTNRAPVAWLGRRKWMLSAASIALLVTAGLYFFKQREPHNKGGSVQVAAITPEVQPGKDTVIINRQRKKTTVALKDGSQVLLSPQAAIRFKPGFPGATREIHLEGEAYFKVAKNKRKPFIVYSRGITTTALGTSFTIRAPADEQQVAVTLHTGKVVIRPIKARAGAPVYLLPGDQLIINTQTFATHIEKEKPAITPVKETPVKKTSVLDFDRDPLAKVFNKLTQEYATAIEYDETLLSGLSFTGSIKTTDPLEKILQNIALLNNLTVTKTSKGYHVGTGQ